MAEFSDLNSSLSERLTKSIEYSHRLEEELTQERHAVEQRDADISVKTMEIQELRNKMEEQMQLHQEYKTQVEAEQRNYDFFSDFLIS